MGNNKDVSDKLTEAKERVRRIAYCLCTTVANPDGRAFNARELMDMSDDLLIANRLIATYERSTLDQSFSDILDVLNSSFTTILPEFCDREALAELLVTHFTIRDKE